MSHSLTHSIIDTLIYSGICKSIKTRFRFQFPYNQLHFSAECSSFQTCPFSSVPWWHTVCFHVPTYGLTHSLRPLPAHRWSSFASTYSCSWCTHPSQSPCCRWTGRSRWCWSARTHTFGAGCPWTAGGRWGQRRSGRRRSGSSRPKASSQTGSGRRQWSWGLEGNHAHTYTNHAGDAGAAAAPGTNRWDLVLPDN